MGEIISSTSALIGLILVLISFGVVYGSMKTKQDQHADSLQEIKNEFKALKEDIRDEFKEFRREFEMFRHHCKGLCQYPTKPPEDQ